MIPTRFRKFKKRQIILFLLILAQPFPLNKYPTTLLSLLYLLLDQYYCYVIAINLYYSAIRKYVNICNLIFKQDSLMGIYVYGLKSSEELELIYYGCFEVHTGVIKGIAVTESKKGCLTVYSAGKDHRIAVFRFDKT